MPVAESKKQVQAWGGQDGAQGLPPCALYRAGRNAYPT